MKTPRRDFVVEYKASRRQIPPGTNSIWGNLDLKAIASKVDSSLLGQSRNANEVDATAPVVPDPAIGNTEKRAAGAVTDCSEADASSPSANIKEPLELPVETVEEIAPMVESAEVAPSRERQRKQKRPRKRVPATVHVSVSDESMETSAQIISDNLDELTRENERLKSLLREKLISENTRLKNLLNRFN